MITFSILLIIQRPVLAQERTFPTCGDESTQHQAPESAQVGDQNLIDITADHVEATGKDNARFQGNVTIQYQQRTIQSGDALIDRTNNTFKLNQGVTLFTKDMVLEGESADYKLDQESGQFNQSQFYIPRHGAHGSAGTVSINGNSQAKLTDVSYTTCPDDDPDWTLVADEIVLDNSTNTGEAYHLTIDVKGVPVFYLPYINFPLQGRKSGLLPPSYTNSERNGHDFRQPWYWNIAPNMDATITPRIIERRGNMLHSEYRYIDEHSQGSIQLGWLNHDDISTEQRGDLSVEYRYYKNGWFMESDYFNVTDNNYLNEIGADRYAASASLLKQQFAAGYNSREYQFLVTALQYQSLTAVNAYKQLPNISFSWTPALSHDLEYGLKGDWSRFVNNDQTKIEGDRLDVTPYIAYPMAWQFGFLRPKLGIRSTHYALDSANQNRTIPITSIHGGLYFDRNNEDSTQTLEPEVFYLHVPYRDQSALPVFYSAEVQHQWQQLFADNRYSGADRQSDANQLTTALSSRFFQNSAANPWLELRMGKIIPLSQPKVITATSWDSSSYSDLLTEIRYQPHIYFSLLHQAAIDSDGTINNSLGQISVTHPDGMMKLSLRNNRLIKLKQSDAIVNWKLSERWQGIGRWVRDMEQNLDESVILGLEYRSCCWAIRLAAQDEWKSDTLTTERSYTATIELKGLARLGDTLEQALGLE